MMFFRGVDEPHDATVWHKWHVFFPVRTIAREWTITDVWRKRDGAKWLYQKRAMSEEDRADLTTY